MNHGVSVALVGLIMLATINVWIVRDLLNLRHRTELLRRELSRFARSSYGMTRAIDYDLRLASKRLKKTEELLFGTPTKNTGNPG